MKPPYDIICFDCDSTLSAIEGIDELAARAGVMERSAVLTNAAMDGRMPLEDIYGSRLELIRPKEADMEWLGRRYIKHAVDGSRELIDILLGLGKAVHIISGGIQQGVLILGAELGIQEQHMHAVPLQFDEQGNYAGYDQTSLLARSGGKTAMMAEIIQHGERAVLVGDGITDLEVQASGMAFIGFGGVKRRESVANAAEHYIEDASLLALLDYLITPNERAKLDP